MLRRIVPSLLAIVVPSGVVCFAGCGTENVSEFEPDSTSSSSSSSSSTGGIEKDDGGHQSSSGSRPGPGCGNSFHEEGEECDDGNAIANDGCSSTCKIESGYECPREGAACVAICGDGVLLGREDCDDGNTESGDGCSAGCNTEPGYVCETAGQPCLPTVCGDGVTEGSEQCDDGPWATDRPYDGCFHCVREPSCGPNGCSSSCGDGLLFPDEECDDGNTRNGDGCSSECKFEQGFKCKVVTEPPPAELVLPVIYRDFKSPYDHSSASTTLLDEPLNSTGHPDFERFKGWAAYRGLVKNVLADDRLPAFNDTIGTPAAGTCALANPNDARCVDARQMLTGESEFGEWYHDGARSKTVLSRIRLTRNAANDSYVFDSNKAPYSQYRFFPLDPGNPENTGTGWGIETDKVCRDVFSYSDKLVPMFCYGATPGSPNTTDGIKHNFLFTTELRFWFTYKADGTPPSLNFTGDDDVWIFINGKLVVDLGGLHNILDSTFVLGSNAADLAGNPLNLQDGRVYEISLFHAERHSTASNFKFTLSGFIRSKTSCQTECGDGFKTPDETCDDGVLAGGYNQCGPNCVWGPRCGDGIVQSEYGEECDDGNFTQDDGCLPNCKHGNRIE